MMKTIINEIQNGGIFDSEWYSEQYPDVKKSKLSPIEHYLKFGHKLNRKPAENFDISKYIKIRTDIDANDVNQLLHYSRTYNAEKITAGILFGKENKVSYINQYFDHIYVVNLKHKIADRLKVSAHLNENNISFELFTATNGYCGKPLEHFKEYSSRKLGSLVRYSQYNEKEIEQGSLFLSSAGAIGYIYTYVEILKDAKNKGYKNILILEDDIILSKDFEVKFKEFTKSISTEWKVLQLGASQYGWSSVNFDEAKSNGYYFPRAMDTKGSFAIAFDNSTFDEVIDAVTSFEAPFDHAPMAEIYEKYLGKCFVAYPYLIIPDVSESSIRGSRCQVSHSKRMKWPLDNFDYPLTVPSIAVIITSKENLRYYESFVNSSEMPFILRLYINTVDGLRPLHNPELLDFEYNKIIPCCIDQIGPIANYVVTLDENECLTEKHIVEFIESKLKNVNSTSLTEIKLKKIEVITGRVSVIIPTYKRPKNLQNALRSVVEQDYNDLEIIVVSDNGYESEFNEGTVRIIDSFRKTHPHRKITFLKHSFNRNGSAARNTGIAHSSGEFISFLDDDDIYLQGRITKSVSALKSKPKSIGGLYCGFLGWNSSANDLNRYSVGDLTYEILALEYKSHYLHTNTATYRREAILNINGFDESYRRHQDLEFNLRFFERYKIDAIKECLVQLNPEPSNVSNKVFDMEMLNLKKKFLDQFSYLIKSFEQEKQKVVFSRHYDESLKYVKEKKLALSQYKSNFKDYNSQIALRLIDNSDRNESPSLRLNSQCDFNKDIGFYRIIGNNIPGLHSKEQSYENLKFIIENEPSFDNTVKYFVLNRIIDDKVRYKIIDLLESNACRYLEIDFDYRDFISIGYDLKNLPDSKYWFGDRTTWQKLAANSAIRASKNRYLMNNNGARNFALNHGRKRHEWTMPWDGNCFLSKPHFIELESAFKNSTGKKYITTPMERLSTNDSLNSDSIAYNANEEPQISFFRGSIENFNEDRVYGNQPKVELFKRIGSVGIWDEYVNLYPWKKLEFVKSVEFGLVDTSSAVFRLFSGNVAAIEAKNRTHTRAEGLADFIDEIESQHVIIKLQDENLKKTFLEYVRRFLEVEEVKILNKEISTLFSSGHTKKEKEVKLRFLLEKACATISKSDCLRTILEYSLVVFVRNLNRKTKVVDKEILHNISQIMCSFKLSEVDESNKLDLFKKSLYSHLISLVLNITLGDCRSGIKHKIEVVMLMYYFYDKKLPHDESLTTIFELSCLFFEEVFNYKMHSDLPF